MCGGRVAELKETRKEGKGSKTSIKDLILKQNEDGNKVLLCKSVKFFYFSKSDVCSLISTVSSLLSY